MASILICGIRLAWGTLASNPENDTSEIRQGSPFKMYFLTNHSSNKSLLSNPHTGKTPNGVLKLETKRCDSILQLAKQSKNDSRRQSAAENTTIKTKSKKIRSECKTRNAARNLEHRTNLNCWSKYTKNHVKNSKHTFTSYQNPFFFHKIGPFLKVRGNPAKPSEEGGGRSGRLGQGTTISSTFCERNDKMLLAVLPIQKRSSWPGGQVTTLQTNKQQIQ